METSAWMGRSDAGGIKQSGDHGLHVRFFLKDGVEYIEIRIPGDRTLRPRRHATGSYRARFAAEYEAFKAGKTIGTPLSVLELDSDAIDDMAGAGIYTLEGLANVMDGNLGGGGALTLRQRARDWLEEAGKKAAAAEIEARDRAIADSAQQITELKAQVAELMAAMSKKGGR
jgi:hypothetical protein